MKITVGQLRRIIKEEVEQEKARKIARETVNEGIWDNITAALTGKVDGKAVPPGVNKSDWVRIMKAAKTLPAERRSAFIADSTLQVKENPGRITSPKTWLKDIELQEEEETEMSSKEKARLTAHEKAREAEERQNAEYAKYIGQGHMAIDKLDAKEKAEKEAKDKEEEDRLLRRGKAPYNPSGSSSMGKASDAW